MPRNFEDLNDSLGSFEGSLVPSASRISLVTPHVQVVLLAVDGSAQDPAAIALASEMATRLAAEVVVMCAVDTPSVDRNRALGRATEDLARAPRRHVARVLPDMQGPHARQLLQSIEQVEAGLLVAAAPYGDDLALCADESLGQVVDILLAELAVPALFVRQPIADPSECFRHIVMPVHVTAQACGLAASWAFRLVDQGGTVEVVSVVDSSDIAGSQSATETLDEQLRGHRSRLGALVAAVQRRGAETGVDVRVEIEVGRTIERLLAHSESSPSLLCASLPSDRKSLAFHRVQDLLLASTNPVLTVPGRPFTRS